MKWTTEQQLAIEMDGSNIIVSAGAGSGKTAVLSERVLQKVLNGVDIRKILILTFTNEAAGEMSARIRKKIKKSGLKEQLEYLDSAYITTFDAYALSLVKKYHYVLNINKDIKIIDASIVNLERRRLLDKIFDEFYQAKDEEFLCFVKTFTMRDDEILKNGILNINEGIDLKYDKNEYLDNYIENFYNKEYVNKIFNEYFKYLSELVDNFETDVMSLENYMESDAYVSIYDSVSKIFRPKTYDDLYNCRDIKMGRFKGLDEEGVFLKERVKDSLEKIKSLIIYSREDIIKYYLSTKDYVKVIIKVIKKLDEYLNNYKISNGVFEFSDIAKMAIKLVKENKYIKDEIKYYFNEIMIDEYQDTSDLQEIFIREIENDNVYMVGDIKQSIYRFRNANPLIFKNKYDNYSKNIGGRKIDLMKNFRSRSEVLNNINEIFNLLMIKDLGGIDYTDNHEMIYGNETYIESCKNEYNNNLEILTYNDEGKEFSKDEIEAFAIANDIKKKVSDGYLVADFDIGGLRKSNYSDYCIILDRGSSMPLFKKVFEYFHIPMEIYQDNNLMNETEIYIIKNIINLIINISKKIFNKETRYYFTSVARSYLGNMSDEEIYEALEENKMFKSEVYNICNDLSKTLDNETPSTILEKIINRFDIYNKLILVGNVDAGIKRINYLLDLAKNIESLGYTVEDFNTYLNTLVDSKQDITYKEAKSGSVSVKMMNIHKSKGLEFPVCYFTGFKKDFNLRDLQNRFMFDKTYGIITPFYSDGLGVTFVKELIKRDTILEEIAEKIRLFYVALTRAKEKMIMVMPEVKEYPHDKPDFYEESKYRSFYSFLSSIAGAMKKYMYGIDLNSLGLTKDYEFSRAISKNMNDEVSDKINFVDVVIDSEEIEVAKASKRVEKILDKNNAKLLMYGTSLHESLEYATFSDTNNTLVNDLRKYFDFDNAKVYQELEFLYDSDKTYHGIIDLMLEYSDKVIIIDYKLKNINEEDYVKQLHVYSDYVKNITKKDVKLYLYSILEKSIKEII